MTEKFMIFPEPGNTKVIARLLLDLADHPLDVQYVMWPQEGFRVPEDLLLKFEAQFTHAEVPAEAVTFVPEVDETANVDDIPEPVKRKPGRPKKEAQ